MQGTIDKLIMDKRQISEMLNDRENDLRRFNDPKNAIELKNLLGELDSNLTIVEREKNKQYSEMRHLLDYMDEYQKEYYSKSKNRLGARRQKKLSVSNFDFAKSHVGGG
mmetsp:Transcript_11994/g.11874  ORF Transcript_11994/g.11874 Transcript_11994/m.11874 type:complete len:109 (-) Transcript_11994:510-836(-)